MTEKELIEKGLIPLDKSWIIRMGVLDIVNGYSDIELFLDKQKSLSDDLIALKEVAKNWKTSDLIDVGESGTLYRFLRFFAWKLGLNKKFIIHKTLEDREITDNPKIISLPLTELLKLDNKTSQWASASVLLGNKERIINPPYKLRLTFEAVEHWEKRRELNQVWEARFDETILRQTETFLKLLNREKILFVPKQAEDYCFARAFDFIDSKKGEKLWPSLRGHESDRLKEMELVISAYENNDEIESKDHRAVQAIAMKAKVDNKEVKIKFPLVVNKSWPEFWNFISNV